MPKGMRSHAVSALIEVLRRKKKPKEVLDAALSAVTDRRDRAFVSELVYGVLRHKRYLDWVLGQFLRNPDRLAPGTMNNLRTALYQVRFMRTPAWAAVHEAVSVEKTYHGKVSLVNAVMRNILRHQDVLSGPSTADTMEYLSVMTSHPPWVVRRWVGRFGVVEAERALRANNERPPIAVRCRNIEDRDAALSSLQKEGLAARPTAFSPVGVIVEGYPTYHDLSKAVAVPFVLQDEAAQLVTYLVDPKPGERVLDGCAAPGGKATHAAELMNDCGEVIAVEADARRIGQIEENIARLMLHSVKTVHADLRALSGWEPFDKMLVDAPCSALGVVRRNPDVKCRHAERDLCRFQSVQLDILGSAGSLVKVGGEIVFSVCSTEPDEGEEVVSAFLQRRGDFSIIGGNRDFLVPFETVLHGGGKGYRTWPHRHGMDGFFFVKMRRSV
jgi:16S rRNA (cytosine967-C5)-methyltransferase